MVFFGDYFFKLITFYGPSNNEFCIPTIFSLSCEMFYQVGLQQSPDTIQIHKRDALPMPLINDKILYTTELEIGSNKDKVSVSIDTGSYDLWVMSNDAVCYKVSEFQTEGAPQLPDIFNDIDQDYSCTFNGTYNSKSSKTFKNTSEDFSIGYVDGSAAQGVWGYDSVQFGQYGVTGLKIGIANRSSVSDGILGIGIANGYDNFPVLLQKQGLINKIAYSVYLNSSNSTTGTILFGAIDHAKYEGY